MNMKSILLGFAAVLAVSAAGFAHASDTSYYPPDSIHCVKSNNKLRCEGFDRRLLVEDTTTAYFNGKEETFLFTSGAAFYNADKTAANIFYTFRNADQKNVKLKTVDTSMRPDFEMGSWRKVQEDLYICKDDQQNCPITTEDNSKHR